MAFEAPDLALYHSANVDVEQATKLALEAEKAALEYDEKIVNSNGASFNSQYRRACLWQYTWHATKLLI